jgi:DNA polymerase-3 subunit delta
VGGKLFDSFLAEEALERALASAVGREDPDAVQVLHGDETTWTRVVDAARTGSLFAQRRALVVRGAEALKGEGDDAVAYLEDPNPAVALILVAAKPDRRKTVWKRILEKAAVVSAEPLKKSALRAHVQESLRRRQLRIAEESLNELLERFGQDLRRLMGEIDKLQAFAQGKADLSAEDVAAVLGRGFSQPLYMLGDAVSERNLARALEIIESLLEDGEEAPRILGTLHRSLRQVRGALALREAGVPPDEIARRLLPGNMAFKLKALLESTRRWTEKDLGKGIAALAKADRGMKRGAEVRTALTGAVVAACGASRETRPGR